MVGRRPRREEVTELLCISSLCSLEDARGALQEKVRATAPTVSHHTGRLTPFGNFFDAATSVACHAMRATIAIGEESRSPRRLRSRKNTCSAPSLPARQRV